MVQGPHDKTEPPKKILRTESGRMTSYRLGKTCHHGLKFPGHQPRHEKLWFGETAADYPSRMLPAFHWVLREFKNRPSECFDDQCQGHRLAGGGLLGLFEFSQSSLVDGPEAARDNLAIQGLLVPKVVVDRG